MIFKRFIVFVLCISIFSSGVIFPDEQPLDDDDIFQLLGIDPDEDGDVSSEDFDVSKQMQFLEFMANTNPSVVIGLLNDPEFVTELQQSLGDDPELLKRFDELIQKLETMEFGYSGDSLSSSDFLFDLISRVQSQKANFDGVSARWVLFLASYMFYRKMSFIHSLEQGRVGGLSGKMFNWFMTLVLSAVILKDSINKLSPQFFSLLMSGQIQNPEAFMPLLLSATKTAKNVEALKDGAGNQLEDRCFDSNRKIVAKNMHQFGALDFFDSLDDPMRRFLEGKSHMALAKRGWSRPARVFLIDIVMKFGLHVGLFKFLPMGIYYAIKSKAAGKDPKQMKHVADQLLRSSEDWFKNAVMYEVIDIAGYERLKKAKDLSLGIIKPELVRKTMGLASPLLWKEMTRLKKPEDYGLKRDHKSSKYIKEVGTLYLVESVVSHVLFKVFSSKNFIGRWNKKFINKIKSRMLKKLDKFVDDKAKDNLMPEESVAAFKEMIEILDDPGFSEIIMYAGLSMFQFVMLVTKFITSRIEWTKDKTGEMKKKKLGIFNIGKTFDKLSGFSDTSPFDDYEIEMTGDRFNYYDFCAARFLGKLASWTVELIYFPPPKSA